MKKFVVCDLDGTLIDTLIGLTKASNEFMEINNYPYRYEYNDVKELIGNGARKLFLGLTHRSNFDENLEQQYNEFLKIYEKNQYVSKPYPKVIEVLKELNKKDIKIIIYSNKPKEILDKLVNYLFKDIEILKVLGSEPQYKVKPDVTLLNKVLEEFDLSNYEGLYIGDSYTDYLTAINAKMDMLFLTYGYCHNDEKKRINCIKIANFDEILNYLK